MRYAVRTLTSCFLTLAVTAAGAQEIQMGENGNSRVLGTIHYIDAEQNRIVVNDMSYSLGQAVWIDGTRHKVDRLTELLDRNETVELELSGESGNGYPKAIRIHTNP